MANLELLEQEIQFIKDNPEKWNQKTWVQSCGTYGCLAGNTVVHEYGGQVFVTSSSGAFVASKEMEFIETRWTAQNLLGLLADEADAFFDAHNTLPVLEALLKDLQNGEEVSISDAQHYQFLDAQGKL